MEHVPYQPDVNEINVRESFGNVSGDHRSIPANAIPSDVAAKILQFLSDLASTEPGNLLDDTELQELADEFEAISYDIDEALRRSAQKDSDTPDDELPD